MLNHPVLSNITMTLTKGKLISVVGKIGSGKTSLLMSLLKEIPAYSG